MGEGMNEEIRAALAEVLAVADAMGLRALLVGAWARDLCLPSDRRGDARHTNDVDLVVALDDWKTVDAFFDACAERFDDHRQELFLRHRLTSVKVDVVPCGGIEAPPGCLPLRASRRILNTVGLLEAFASASPLPLERFTLHVPSPSAYVLIKLLSFLDRRAPKDLRDLAYVVKRAPIEEERIWSDEVVMDGFAEGRLTLDDMAAWQIGRGIGETFSPTTTRQFAQALDALAAEAEAIRGLLVEKTDPDERIRAADRTIHVLQEAATGKRQ
jgi:predicted nucleotidyltransferase